MTSNYSAILTTYNSEFTVKRALDSILNQTDSPVEVIIVDDCSTDNTWKILEGQANIYHKIKLFSTKSNSGPAGSRNMAIENCSHDVVIFFDDDDVSAPQRSSIQLRNLEKSNLCYVSSEKIYNNSYKTNHSNIEFYGQIDACNLIKYLLMGTKSSNFSFFVPASTLAARRSDLEKIGKFDTNLRRLEDVDLAIQASINKLLFFFSNEILVSRYYTTAPDKNAIIESDSQIKVLNKYKQYVTLKFLLETESWYKLRRLYFGRKYLYLIFNLIIHICKFGLNKRTIEIGINRIRHDAYINQTKND